MTPLSQGANSRVTLGIASPCSTCTNRNSLPGADGSPACPRAVLGQQQGDSIENGEDFSSLVHLTLSGLEANPYATASPGVFSNPVYDTGNNAIYVWVARLVDNQGSLNPDGSTKVPPLTDPGFLDSYASQIQCMPLPMIPSDTLAQYYTKGRIEEGESVLIHAFEDQQIDSYGNPVVYGGNVSKLSIYGSFPVSARVTKDDHPRGT